MIYDYELEKQFLAALLKEPQQYYEIANLVSSKDFYSRSSSLHATIFSVIKQALDASDEIDDMIVAQRLSMLGLSFEDNVNPADYVRSLALRKVPAGHLVKITKELKKLTIRREIYESAREIALKMKNLQPDVGYAGIVAAADDIYNSKINLYEIGDDAPENIYSDMEALIEERGENPVTEFGLMGPHPKLNSMYGSLLRAGNITVIVARAGCGKTQFAMDFATKVSARYDVPVLHFDNGEMSKEELQIRQCAALSGVKMHLLETGLWRRTNADTVKAVRDTWAKVKNLKFYYYNVGGMDVDAMVKVLKRFYYNKIGRGKPLIFSFDYIKTSAESKDRSEYQIVGEIVDKFKRVIQKEITTDGKPMISMITSVQSNRLGITNNRTADNVIDDESIVSLSDRIVQFASHMFILRKKTMDEIEAEGRAFGTHKLINVKARHLGEDIAGALDPVHIGDALRKNFVNLEFNNFHITEKGDLRDIARFLGGEADLEHVGAGDLPDL